MPHPESASRLARAAAALRDRSIDALLLTPNADQFYLTGFEHGHAFRRLLALILKADGSGSWITPLMNESQVKEFALPEHPVRGWGDGEGYLPALREALQGVGSVAFDEEARAAFLLDLLDVAPGTRLHRAGEITRELRIRKTPAELELLRHAGRVVDETIEKAISFCVAGRTEEEVDELLRAALLAHSEDSTIGFTIVASGPNGANPHHDTGRRVLEQGDLVILDFGTRYHGYNSDITVTCSVGEPKDPEARKVYRIVWEAQQAALEAIRPGVTGEEVDRAARSVIEAAGYGEYFIHRTGHGLGIQIHEPPYMVAGNQERLEEGNVFSIEPGIYLPGRFGVRLEVIASVAADGVSLINAPRVSQLPVSG